MNVLGIRCSNKDFSYSVINGQRGIPNVITVGSLIYPKNLSHPRSLLWFVQETEQLIKKHNIQAIVVKKFEGMSRGSSFEERVEYEACVSIAAAKVGLTVICKKVKSTIAKDFGLKGRARYLETGLDTSVIPKFTDYTDKEQEAILCAWSDLT
jgi:hypothetical protein